MKTLKQACTPRKTVFDAAKRDTVLSLNNLVRNQIEPAEFFEENHITQGMRLLLENGFKRLESKIDQGIFRLTQAMGGGKTHNLIAFGLLARHPELRPKVMQGFYTPDASLGAVRVVAFSGRESDAPFGIWGAIADQLGKKEFFNGYYTPLSAPGQTAWANLLRGDPLLILLDELPPYFENARTKSIGASDLSVATGTALANLFVAIMEDLPNVCLVITDLTAAYASGTQQIIQALDNLHKEASRVAMDLEPVRMNTDEFYHILRKRIFEKMPSKDVIEDVAQAYSKAVRNAKQMDITSASPEQFAAQIVESYPFHPAIRDLYARFKENQGFQQTRGLIRLMRVIVSRMWEDATADPYLIAAHNIDLNHRETLVEVRNINPTLEAAIAHDIASSSSSIAEKLDENRGGTNAQDMAKLLLIASLATVPGAIKGLVLPEIVAYLCEPGRDVSGLKAVLLDYETGAWYLHRLGDGKLYFKDVQNLVAKLNTTAQGYLPEQSSKELRNYLERLFKPQTKWCYQDMLALPAVDDIHLEQDRVLLVIAQWHPNGLHPDLRAFYEQTSYQNRLLFLTGQRNFDAMLDAARRYKAIQQIVGEMEAERVPSNDPQLVQAREMLDKFRGQLLMAVKEGFTQLHYPNRNGLVSADFIMQFTDNEYHGEDQIVATLRDVSKYTEEITGDIFVKKVEARLLTQQSMPWPEIKKRAATNVAWQWHKPDALDALKADCLRRDVWREEGTYVTKGPFEKPAASATVQVISRDEVTGKVTLRLNPVNADTIYVEKGSTATTASHKLNERTYETDALELSILAVDSSGEHKAGDLVTWKGIITLKWKPQWVGNDLRVELVAAPQAPIRYTTDGTNPKTYGASYEGPFLVPKGTRYIQAVAERDGILSNVESFAVEWNNRQEFKIDPVKPASWARKMTMTSTQTSYEFLGRIIKHRACVIGGELTVTSGKDEECWLQFNFGDAMKLDGGKLTATLNGLKEVLSDGVVSVRANRLLFETGQGLLDFAAEVKTDVKPDEVKQ